MLFSFNFSYSGSIDPNALAGFQAAGQQYAALFTDDMTVNIKIGFRNLGKQHNRTGIIAISKPELCQCISSAKL